MTAPAIALLTDFGLTDAYVAQMKGVFLRMAPGVPVVDITHGVTPFAIGQGAFLLASTAPHYPEGTVFMSVVDPGVGSNRRIVCIESMGSLFLLPDNGLAGMVLQAAEGDGTPVRAWDLSNTPEARHSSNTFHGRDIFAPLAAKIATGTPPSALGPEITIDTLDIGAAYRYEQHKSDGIIRFSARVLHVDQFGNCILNLPKDLGLDNLSRSYIFNNSKHLNFALNYAGLAEGETGILLGSQGYYEISTNRDSAAKQLDLRPEAIVTLATGA